VVPDVGSLAEKANNAAAKAASLLTGNTLAQEHERADREIRGTNRRTL
jgi:hypothetical protein